MQSPSKPATTRSMVLSAAMAVACLTGCGGDGDDKPPVDVNRAVKSVIVVGTNVTNQIYSNGQYGITLVPKDEAGQAVLGAGLKVGISISTPVGFTSQVQMSECTQAAGGAGLSVGVIIDDSGSMSGNDPMLKRKDATVAFIDTLGPNDDMLLTDYGVSGPNLRDLPCVHALAPDGGVPPASATMACIPPQATGFTGDKAALKASTVLIRASGGTPLWESCVQMLPLVAGRVGRRQAILLLSDGLPNSNPMAQKDCTEGAIKAGIPIFTVGLGPAAEKPDGSTMASQPAAVKVLRELASTTNGAYASADKPEELMALFSNIGTALSQGKCGSVAVLNEFMMLNPGVPVAGTVVVGDSNATGTFQFVAPPR